MKRNQWQIVVAASFVSAPLVSQSARPAAPAKALPQAPAKAADIKRFVQNFCADCHSGDKPKAAFNMETLKLDFDDGATAAAWEGAFDKVQRGEMPPPDSEQPKAEEKTAFLNVLRERLHAASLARQSAGGRALMRRLNKVEYENTLRDLLGVPLHAQNLLPDDASAAGFDTVGAALNISPVHLVRYQQAAQSALLQAMSSAPPLNYREKFTGREWFEREVKGNRKAVPRGAAVEGENVILCRQTPQHWELNVMPRESIRVPGLYRVRLTASARNTGGKPLPLRFGWEWMMQNTALTHIVAYRDAPPDKPGLIEVLVNLPPGAGERRIGVTAYTLKGLSDNDTSPDIATEPGFVVHEFEIEGPIGDWPSAGHKKLFGDLPLEPRSWQKLRAEGKMPQGDWKNWGRHEFIKNPLVPVSQSPKEDAERLIRAFLPQAFRRPVAPEIADYYVRFAQQRLERGDEFGEALTATYRAALCSPHFLFLLAKAGPLEDYALASRLSYFLWSSMPDATLLALAAKGELRKTATLEAQVERMLQDPKAERFVDNFTGQWLELRKVLDMKPDEQYHEYDDALGWSLERETKGFFREVLNKNLSVSSFVDTDWTMLNERLAQHYGVQGVSGMEFRRVALKPENHRGGVITQASVLKVTANGSYTSPVKRGVWLLERILGTPPDPPPPDIPAIQPDIRGAVTLRQQIEKHREIKACAGCHAKIDPPGFALENYDVIGGYRERYRTPSPGNGVKADLISLANYPALKKVYVTAPVESNAVTADGKAFKNLSEWKQIALSDKDQLARAFARKLIIYGTGAEIQFADREVLENIVAASRAKNYGVRTLVHEVVKSRLFLNK